MATSASAAPAAAPAAPGAEAIETDGLAGKTAESWRLAWDLYGIWSIQRKGWLCILNIKLKFLKQKLNRFEGLPE